jgi:surface polysaccharide O-acyltransferase-like enzyme
MTVKTSIDDGRIAQFPLIRIFACLAIVLLHLLYASTVYFKGAIGTGGLTAAKSVLSLVEWAVPCFLMITGALLLDPGKEIPGKKLWKYIRRMLLALLIFTLIFQIYQMIFEGDKSLIVSWLKNFVQGESWAHLWYLYLMIGLYLMMPVYKIITAHASDRQLLYLVIVYAAVISVLPMLGICGLKSGFYIPTMHIYPVYLFLGYMIHSDRLRVTKRTAWVLTVGCSVALVLLSCLRRPLESAVFNADQLKAFDELFGYSSILVVGQSIGIFTLLDRMNVSEYGRTSRFVQSLDDCAFGIYLIHMIFIRFVFKQLEINPYKSGGVLIFAGMTVTFFFAAYVITFLLRKIPLADRVL